MIKLDLLIVNAEGKIRVIVVEVSDMYHFMNNQQDYIPDGYSLIAWDDHDMQNDVISRQLLIRGFDAIDVIEAWLYATDDTTIEVEFDSEDHLGTFNPTMKDDDHV